MTSSGGGGGYSLSKKTAAEYFRADDISFCKDGGICACHARAAMLDQYSVLKITIYYRDR